jgi:glycosyltransferase involved in cell wall biosynthesis
VVSRFPLLTETFVLNELLAIESLGWPVELFAIRHQHEPVTQAAARRLESGVHYPNIPHTTAANVRLLMRHTEQWLRLLRLTVVGNACSARFLARTLLVLPVSIGWAEQMQALHVRHVHAHFGSYPAFAALVAARLQGISFSFTVHAHDLFADNVMLAEKVRRANFVVTISEFNRDWLASLVGQEHARRIHVIHCGVDGRAFRFSGTLPTAGRHLVLSVAALREYKGLENLVEACRLLRVAAPEERFLCRIVGDGPLRGTLERQIRRCGLEACVELAGACDQQTIRRLLAQADTFVLPSVVARSGYMDGIPVALMEAMASGVPVVASRLSGIPELVRDGQTGLLVPPGNAAAIQGAILRCWREPALSAARALQARRLVEREYDLQANAHELAALFAQHLSAPWDGRGSTFRQRSCNPPSSRSGDGHLGPS